MFAEGVSFFRRFSKFILLDDALLIQNDLQKLI